MPTFTTVDTYTSPIDAYLARGRLEAEGVAAFVFHDNHIWANWMYAQALGGVKLQVLSIQAEQAFQILEMHRNGDFEACLQSEFELLDQNLCPHCGAAKFECSVSLPSRISVVVFYLIFSIFYNLRKCRCRCVHCGYSWED